MFTNPFINLAITEINIITTDYSIKYVATNKYNPIDCMIRDIKINAILLD